MKFRLRFSPAARRNMRRLDSRVRNRIESEIEALTDNPYPRASLKLKGVNRTWRIRVGAFRVVYEVHEDTILVIVLKVDRRSEDTYRI